MGRLALRILVFLAATVALAIGLWYVLLIVGFAFGAESPECDTSDSCGTFGKIVYEFGGGWPVVGCLALLSGAFVWRFLPIRSPRSLRAGRTGRGWD